MLLLLALVVASCSPAPKDNAERYVVLSPEVAEILASLGVEHRIVGLTQECSYPPSLAEIHKVGAFGAVKLENVIALKPSIVFSAGLEQDGISEDLKRLGYRVESIYPKSLQQLYEEIARIGQITNSQKAAEQLQSQLQREIASIVKDNQGKRRPKVYLEIYRDPLMSVADDSFVGELIALAGGDNVFDRLERDYSRVKAEAVIAAKPDIMICYSRDSLPNILSRKGWHVIPALRDSMIFFEDSIDPDLIQRAGPRIIDGLKALDLVFEQWRT